MTLVLYTYFIAALLGRQMIPRVEGAPVGGKYEDPDLYFPLFTVLQVNFEFCSTGKHLPLGTIYIFSFSYLFYFDHSNL